MAKAVEQKEVVKLEQTKSKWVFVGQVNRLGSAHAFGKGVTKNGKEYESVRFGIKTSKTNENMVELFGQEQDFVYPFSQTKKKETGDGKLKHPFKFRDELPDTYHLIGIKLNLTDGESEELVELDAVPYIKKHLKDGDWVWATGEMTFGEYKNKKGEIKKQTQYSITAISKIDPKDFDAADFEETSSFMQQFVYVGSERVKEDKKVLIDGYSIPYSKDSTKFAKTNGLTVNEVTHAKMATKMLKLKTGDFLEVMGLVRNEAVVEDAPDDTPDDWGSTKPKGMDKGITHTVSELVITAVESFEEKKYSEDDFVVSEAEQTFGKTAKKNPFADDSDDVPFPED
jgi:hypothetical protein